MQTVMPHPFVSTGTGLNRAAPALRLFEKAKRYGIWNPSDLDLTQDHADWLALDDLGRDVILRLTAMFAGGEEAVTLDLLPLMLTISGEGRTEEAMFLTTFLWEEAKHTDFFARFTSEVAGQSGNLSRYHGPAYRLLFAEALPEALGALLHDPSPAAQVRASVTYNLIVEGTLAETGYHAYQQMLAANHLMPGTLRGITHLKQDESRHIAYGVYLISRLVAADPSLWDVAEAQMNRLLPLATGVINEIFDAYAVLPFGLELNMFLGYAAMQYGKRHARIAAARGATLTAVNEVALSEEA